MKNLILHTTLLLITLVLLSKGTGRAIDTPAGFGSSSAIITNPYTPMQAGDRLTYTGYGTYQGYGRYFHAVGTEVIDTVNCLKVLERGNGWDANPESDPEWYYYWFAEDNDQNVWMLQEYSGWTGVTTTFGKTNPVLFAPA